MNRCKWAMNVNEIYTKYHDEEWGEPIHDDQKLYEMLILELFQAGLSWSCILNKRKNFKKAFDNFDINKIINYDENKIKELQNNEGIIRNKLKIKATINNSKIFKEIQKEYGSFDKYIWSFTNNQTIYEFDKVSSELSDTISRDLKKRGMTFVGTIIIYSYLQAVGIINSHESQCFKHCKI
ncbi:MAG: DNA-3-methyladenine glycosylase I [Clostridiales bacterium]|nr:DNA-3-methyladenine glycosylase I [Clostridiales bacterium]